MAHVRRLLDIVACTTWFGPSASTQDKAKSDSGKNAPGAQDKTAKKTTSQANTAKQSSSSKEVLMEADGEMNHSCPKLGSFYEFFSLSHLNPPIQCTISLYIYTDI